jgi:broad specificity phosphatase PhoE
MKIYFTRHGESQANILHMISNRDLPHGLTSNGRDQAVALAEKLMGYPITKIFTSPVPRAVETSKILAHKLKLPYLVVDALREFDCGILEGRSDEAAWCQWQKLFDDWYHFQRYDEYIKGGETFQDVYQRFMLFINGLINSSTDTAEELLCISHGGVYGIMLPLAVKNIDQTLIAKYGFGYTSLITAELHPDGLLCVEWNGQPIESTSFTR